MKVSFVKKIQLREFSLKLNVPEHILEANSYVIVNGFENGRHSDPDFRTPNRTNSKQTI
jgi:hypothetical protein